MSVVFQSPAANTHFLTTRTIPVSWSKASTDSMGDAKITPASGGSYYLSLRGGDTSLTFPANMGLTINGTSRCTIELTYHNALGTYRYATLYVYLDVPPIPGRPTMTSPTDGKQMYPTESLSVGWTYVPDVTWNLPQTKYEVAVAYGSSTAIKTTIAAYTGSGTSTTLQGNTFTQLGSAYLFVRTGNEGTTTMGWSSWSNPIAITILSTVPDTPNPSTPLDHATTYPMEAVTVTFTFAAKGLYTAQRAIFQYRYSGSANWTTIYYVISGTGTITFTVPASTFTVGQVLWRMAAENTNGEVSPYSAERTLNIVSSTPLSPTLTSPANGATLYNNEAVNYQWRYNANAALGQYRFRLQWRRQGDANWTTVEQVTSASNWVIDHGQIAATIEWRVQTANVYGEWSPYSAVSAYHYQYPVPVVTVEAPTGGYIDPTFAQAFSWSYSSPIGLPVAGGELAYRLSGATAWTTVTLGAVLEVVLPAGTLPVGDVQWRVRMRDSNSHWSDWTAVLTIQTRDVAPSAPTPLEPIGVYVPISDAIRFGWRHNSPIGTPQGGATIEYRLDAGAWITLNVVGSAQAYTLVSFAIMPGVVSWRVRTSNRDGIFGAWSPINSFSVTGAAVDPTILTATANGARPKITWVADGQIVYQVELRDEAGEPLDRTEGAALDDMGSYIAPMFLVDGIYTILVRAKNAYNFWSNWVAVIINIISPARQGPILAATADGQSIRLDLDGLDWEAVDRVIIYRDGEPVIRGDGNQFYDRTAAGNVEHVYFARAVYDDNTFADSAEARAVLPLAYSVITAAGTDGATWEVRLNRDGPPAISGTSSRESELIELAGRALPVVEYGEHIRIGRSVAMVEMGATDADKLGSAYRLGVPVLLRDLYGGRGWCRIASVTEAGIMHRPMATVRSLQISLDEVDYDERVSID